MWRAMTAKKAGAQKAGERTKEDKQKVIYYKDEHNDEFSKAVIKAKKIDKNYRYIRDGFFEKAASFFLYRIVAMPLARLFLKIKFAHKIKNRAVLKKQKSAYFLYANHTSAAADPFIPTFTAFPKRVYVVVHPANVSMPVLGKLTPYLGALPLGDDLAATRNFNDAVDKRISQDKAVCIYPEAHIWPYCTWVRDFSDASFRFPVKYHTPAYCFTNVYTKRRFFKTPRITTYVDGPFYPDMTLPPVQARRELRDRVYEAMQRRSRLSDYDGIVYVKENTHDKSAVCGQRESI